MVLSDSVIATLNEISSKIKDKSRLSENDTQLIKEAFNQILARGDRYDVEEIESWLENHESWTHRPTIVRITNLSHYVLSRFQQSPKKFKIISNDDSCGCH
ncbi:MAG TPA: hypothetical protein VNK44_01805 [Candidatus Nitrosotenuis sp.]|nr:hypothetical protein [Candidatus Nitrosotenuis sp.]